MKTKNIFYEARNYPGRLDNDIAFNNILKALHDKELLHPITLHEEMKMLRKVVRRNKDTKAFYLDYILLYSHLLPFVIDEEKFVKEYNNILQDVGLEKK